MLQHPCSPRINSPTASLFTFTFHPTASWYHLGIFLIFIFASITQSFRNKSLQIVDCRHQFLLETKGSNGVLIITFRNWITVIYCNVLNLLHTTVFITLPAINYTTNKLPSLELLQVSRWKRSGWHLSILFIGIAFFSIFFSNYNCNWSLTKCKNTKTSFQVHKT